MMAKSHLDVLSGSDFHEKSMDGTSTSASIWHVARVPVNRKCFEASSYFAGSPVDFPNHFECHSCRSGYRVDRRPAWLINYCYILHLKREGVPVGTNTQSTLWNRNHPVKSGRGNGRMKVVRLVSGDSLSPEQC
jgi:hypothetical protein